MGLIPGTLLERNFELSASQKKLHELSTLTVARVRNLGDGYVVREPANEHLQGSLLHYRRRPGDPVYVLPLVNELIHIQEVTKSLDGQMAKISGTEAASGAHIPGEIDDLDKVRQINFNWLAREPGSEAWIDRALQEMVDSRIAATNEDNRRIALLADRAAAQVNNPGAQLAVTLVLRKAFAERYRQLVRSRAAEAQRTARTLQWLFDENAHLEAADQTITRLLAKPDEGDYNQLHSLDSKISFAVQPFNLFDAEITPYGGRMPDEEAPLVHLRQGIHLIGDKNYLITPLRWLNDAAEADITDMRHDKREATITALQERFAHLEGMELSGPYAELRGKILPLFGVAIQGMEKQQGGAVKNAAKHAATLLIYQCMPHSGDPLQAAFYSRKGRDAKAA